MGVAAQKVNQNLPNLGFDLTSFDLSDAFLPPAWMEGGKWQFLLGTDDQGRDLLSAILYGLRVSLEIGLSSVFISVALGVSLGLISGYPSLADSGKQKALNSLIISEFRAFLNYCLVYMLEHVLNQLRNCLLCCKSYS